MKGYWQGLNKDTAPKAIITGTELDYQHLHEYKQKDLGFLGAAGFILDFACGIGRNSYPLLDSFESVSCYDLPNMIEIMKSTDIFKEKGGRLKVYNNWDEVKTQKFDKIFSCIGLQHIFEGELISYLRDFKEMSNNLYVFGRWYCDDNYKPMIDLLLKEFTFVSALGYSLDEIKNMKGQDHYFVHLTPRQKL